MDHAGADDPEDVPPGDCGGAGPPKPRGGGPHRRHGPADATETGSLNITGAALPGCRIIGWRSALPADGGPAGDAEGDRAAGPNPEVDKMSAWRLIDLCRIVQRRCGVTYSEGGLSKLMRSLDLSWKTPRPQHA